MLTFNTNSRQSIVYFWAIDIHTSCYIIYRKPLSSVKSNNKNIRVKLSMEEDNYENNTSDVLHIVACR